jgi:hypothetical protein
VATISLADHSSTMDANSSVSCPRYSAAALLSISHLHPLFDSSVQPGDCSALWSHRDLASGLSRVGATVLLVAIAATDCCSPQIFHLFDSTKSSSMRLVLALRLSASFLSGSERGGKCVPNARGEERNEGRNQSGARSCERAR